MTLKSYITEKPTVPLYLQLCYSQFLSENAQVGLPWVSEPRDGDKDGGLLSSTKSEDLFFQTSTGWEEQLPRHGEWGRAS